MKKLALASSVIAALSIVACAKSFRALDIEVAPKAQLPEKANVAEENISYSGELLILSKEGGAHVAKIRLGGANAQIIFDALNIKPNDQAFHSIAYKTKVGVDMICSALSPKEDAEALNHACELQMNPQTGEVARLEVKEGVGEKLSETPGSVRTVIGKNVALAPSPLGAFGRILITEKDAEVLFSQLPKVEGDETLRLGKNVKCIAESNEEAEAKAKFSCAIYFNYLNGQVTLMKPNTPMSLQAMIPASEVSGPADSISSPAGQISGPADSVSSPAGQISGPAGSVSTPLNKGVDGKATIDLLRANSVNGKIRMGTTRFPNQPKIHE